MRRAAIVMLLAATMNLQAATVLFDRSHEANSSLDPLAKLLNRSGVGVIDNWASLVSVAPRLSAVQALVIWQEAAAAPFTAAEQKLVKEFAEGGGTVVLVGNLGNWLKRNVGSSPADCPLVGLAGSMGLAVGEADSRQPVGRGRVGYVHNTGILNAASLNEEVSKGPGEGTKRMLAALGMSAGPASKVKETIYPDGSFTVGRVQVQYPLNLSERAMEVKGWLEVMLTGLEKEFGTPLETSVHVNAIAFTGSAWAPVSRFSLNVSASKSTVMMDLGRELANAWYFPGGREVKMPAWVSVAWNEAVTVRVLERTGLDPKAGELLRILERERTAAQAKGITIDLAKVTNAWDGPARANAVRILERIEKETGTNVSAGLRRAVRVCHAAGDIAMTVDTNSTVRILSLGLGRDVSGYFRSMGTTVETVTPDYRSFAVWSKELDELLSPPTE